MTQVQLTLRDLSRLVVLQTQKGMSRDEVVQVLVARGWPEVSAVRFVDMTLFEQGGQSSRAWASEEEKQSTRQTFSTSRGSGKAFLVAVFFMVILMALLIASVLSILAR